MNRLVSSLLITLAALANVNAFAPNGSTFGVPSVRSSSLSPSFTPPAALQRQRHSVAQVQTMGLFGLGAPEIGVILVAAAFLLGPDKLAEFGKDAGKIAGELKEVPKEFQAGMAEGEASAQATKKKMESADAEVEKKE
jgi:sec-independent protein translocase protein TatA